MFCPRKNATFLPTLSTDTVRCWADHQFEDCSTTKVQQLACLRKRAPSYWVTWLTSSFISTCQPAHALILPRLLVPITMHEIFLYYSLTKGQVCIYILGFSLALIHGTLSQWVFQIFSIWKYIQVVFISFCNIKLKNLEPKWHYWQATKSLCSIKTSLYVVRRNLKYIHICYTSW